MPTFYDVLEIIKEDGTAITTRCEADAIWRFRIIAGNGGLQWGDGEKSTAGFGPIIQELGERPRILFELNKLTGYNVGISLNSGPDSDCLSITAEDGCLVIRNETQSADSVIAVIGKDGIEFPQKKILGGTDITASKTWDSTRSSGR